MKPKLRNCLVYGSLVAVLGLAIALSVCCEEVDLFFTGALVFFAGLLWYVNVQLSSLQKDFNDWTRKRIQAREDPEIIPHGKTKFMPVPNKQAMQLIFQVSNPGEVLVSVVDVQIIEAAIKNPTATGLTWISKYPLLSQSMPVEKHKQEGFPAPIFAGGLTELIAIFEFDDEERYNTAKQLKRFHYSVVYKVGASPVTKPADWEYVG
jgi:hypothetical protein